MKVLVVDDEKDVQQLFEQYYEDEIARGVVEFKFVFSAEEALEYLSTFPDSATMLILSDINMPGITGLELLKKIKNQRPALKVIMVTAYGDDANKKRAEEYGCDDFITKPINFDLLSDAIKIQE